MTRTMRRWVLLLLAAGFLGCLIAEEWVTASHTAHALDETSLILVVAFFIVLLFFHPEDK
jgi:preprotein translocase subunit SecG